MKIDSFSAAGRTLVVRFFPASGEERRQLLALEKEVNEFADATAIPMAINGQTGISIIFKPKKKLP